MFGPSIDDFILDGPPPVYKDKWGRRWVAIAYHDRPTIMLQREDCAIPPLEMPRLSVDPTSPWAKKNWTKVEETD